MATTVAPPTSSHSADNNRRPSPPPPFHFPPADSTVLPDPSAFFSPSLLSSPLPTNSFFQNFTLNNGDNPEYIHPYLVKSSGSAVSLCYPSLSHTSDSVSQIFTPDLTLKPNPNSSSAASHLITSYSDLSVTLDFPSSNLRLFLVRGSPYITCSVVTAGKTAISLSTVHSVVSCCSNDSLDKHTVKLGNNQTWLVYSSSPVSFSRNPTSVSSGEFSGVLRIAILPDPKSEPVLDRFSSCYPVSGEVAFTKPFSLDYKWGKEGAGELLMLAHPLHLKLLSPNDCGVTVLEDLKYRSVDGDLIGVVGDSWVLKSDPVPVTWHSIKGDIKGDCLGEIVAALRKDVEGLDPSATTTTSCYFYGKSVARAARLAVIAEEVGCTDVIPAVGKFLKEMIEPWLEGSFNGNGFLYDRKWGGIISKQGLTDSGGDFGFGVYNDHHFHLSYYLYSIAVLAKIDPVWGRKYQPQVYSMIASFMNFGPDYSIYTRLRCFDLYKLHSWGGGMTEYADGRNQESTSEAVNAYYSAALIGLAYGDTDLVATASCLAAMEIKAAQMWWHVREEGKLYPQEFTAENRVVGLVWANKRETRLWFAPPEQRECRLGIHLLPLLPITEVLFADVEYARQLVNWTVPSLERGDVGDGWKGFAYALEALYDKGTALEKVRRLNEHDDGNSLSNMLWWIHSR